MTRDVRELAQRRDEEEENKMIERSEEVQDTIDMARDEVSTYQEDLRTGFRDIEARLREEEVAARDRLVYEHQSMEASLLDGLKGRAGALQTVPVDKFAWTVEWDRAPQEFRLNISCIRGLRSKLREGYYVIMASVCDRVGGQTLRFSSGHNGSNKQERMHLDCVGTLPPLRFRESSDKVDQYINLAMERMLCPAPKMLQCYATLVFEVWQLRVGNYDRTDKVVGWGVFPLVNRDFSVVEGKFRIPLIRGEVDKSIDTYRHVTASVQDDLKNWLGNLYFEINMTRADHNILKAKFQALERKGLAQQEALGFLKDKEAAAAAANDPLAASRNSEGGVPEVVTSSGSPQMRQDKLRLKKTIDDHQKLIVPKLPPRLFFDDVALDSEGSQGLRRRYFGESDLRPLNAALWEKRAMLEDERQAMAFELKAKQRLTDDNALETDRLVRLELTRDKNHLAKNIYRRYPEINFADVNNDISGRTQKDKVTDSHILLMDHHTAIGSQREFIFLGRRYRDRLKIAAFVLLSEMGINFYGEFQKGPLVKNFVFLVVSLIARNVVHSFGVWMFLNFKDVPLTVQSWNAFHTDMRFEFADRFYPIDTVVTLLVGFVTGIAVFNFFSFALFCILFIFKHVPYFVTRFFFWFGVAIFFDPVITSCSQAVIGNTNAGDAFIVMAQLEREERSQMSGWLLTLSCYFCLMILQAASVYWFSCAVHLNGRANDVYDRIVFPERSFFLPHDLEVSAREMRDVVADAKKYRDEKYGSVKKIRVTDFNHNYTCYFKARLFKLLEIMSDNPESWINEYIDSIPLRRPRHSSHLIESNLGTYKLGADITSFLRRHFPHLTVVSAYRVGDMAEDSYYEAELMRAVQMHSTPNEDDTEMRNMLKAYFKAQIDFGKPARWSPGDANDEDEAAATVSTPFVITDWQLLADLIFFETSTAAMRSFHLRYYLREDEYEETYGMENPSENSAGEEEKKYALHHFVKGQPMTSTQGREAQGAVVQIIVENPAHSSSDKRTGVALPSLQLEPARVFIVTPFGSIIEPNPYSFSVLEHHTADDTEFWAQRGLDMIENLSAAAVEGRHEL